MKTAISTGIFSAVAFVCLGFAMEGGDGIGTWLPQRIGFGLVFGVVVGGISSLIASWKRST